MRRALITTVGTVAGLAALLSYKSSGHVHLQQVSFAPVGAGPSTSSSAAAPTTAAPTTAAPTTAAPTTAAPTPAAPTTGSGPLGGGTRSAVPGSYGGDGGRHDGGGDGYGGDDGAGHLSANGAGLTPAVSVPATTVPATTVPAPTAPSMAAPSTAAPSTTVPGATSGAKQAPVAQSATRTYTGTDVQYYYGDIQVAITVRGGKVTGITVPRNGAVDGHSQMVNSYAVPVLEQEALAAQGLNFNVVSGATYTSDAFAQSFQSALKAAGL